MEGSCNIEPQDAATEQSEQQSQSRKVNEILKAPSSDCRSSNVLKTHADSKMYTPTLGKKPPNDNLKFSPHAVRVALTRNQYFSKPQHAAATCGSGSTKKPSTKEDTSQDFQHSSRQSSKLRRGQMPTLGVCKALYFEF